MDTMELCSLMVRLVVGKLSLWRYKKNSNWKGSDISDDVHKGLIPRMFDYLFEKIAEADEDTEFSVKVSYLEIYREKVQDLLDRKYLFHIFSKEN